MRESKIPNPEKISELHKKMIESDKALGLKKDEVYKSINLKGKDQIWAYYYTLKKEYERNKIEYNHKSHTLSNKKRTMEYQTLIYKQGCLKMFEYVLGLVPEAQENYNKINSDKPNEAEA